MDQKNNGFGEVIRSLQDTAIKALHESPAAFAPHNDASGLSPFSVSTGESPFEKIADVMQQIQDFFQGRLPEVAGMLGGGAMPPFLQPEPEMTPPQPGMRADMGMNGPSPSLGPGY